MPETTTAQVELITTREIKASRDLAFRLFTEAEHLTNWWAPLPYTIANCTVDLRPGGLWHYAMKSPEGDLHWARGLYQEVDRPDRVTFLDGFSNEKGEATSPEVLFDIRFEGDGTPTTKVTVFATFPSDEYRTELVNMGMLEGIAMTTEQLANYAEKLSAA